MSGPSREPATIHIIRTAIINGVTLAVGAGLWLNGRNNREIELRTWPEKQSAPYVQVIVPVRNEAHNLPDLLQTLLAQQYPQECWGITVVDDGSTDATLAIAQSISKRNSHLQIVQAPPLPPGITGKNHALLMGLLNAPAGADWLLFVDADTRHSPLMLASAVWRAVESNVDMLSLVIDVKMESFWERVLVPQVGELYTLLVGTMDQVNGESGTSAANGQFILIRRRVYEELGALPEVASNVAEDRAMAAEAKARGYRVRLELGRALVSARVYSSLRDMWSGYSKTLFWATGHNTVRSVLVALALAFYAILPPLAFAGALLNGRYPHKRTATRHFAYQVVPMLVLRAFVCRRVGLPPLYALTYPLGVAAGDLLLFHSIFRVLSGRGVSWKGRNYTR